MNKVLFFNPLSAVAKHRIPNSILSIAASINGKYEWTIVDGNRDADPLSKMMEYLETGEYKYVGFTVMPGPQVKQAVPFAKAIKEKYPDVYMIWGGYFPASHYKVILNSGYIDFVVNGPGDHAFPALVDALERNEPYELIKNIIYKAGDDIIKTLKEDLFDQDPLPALPYDK
ncbi:MAG: cobalamin-dependent protein, partial [Flavipsychrobacter sp.]